jgi:hypothetical protein
LACVHSLCCSGELEAEVVSGRASVLHVRASLLEATGHRLQRRAEHVQERPEPCARLDALRDRVDEPECLVNRRGAPSLNCGPPLVDLILDVGAACPASVLERASVRPARPLRSPLIEAQPPYQGPCLGESGLVAETLDPGELGLDLRETLCRQLTGVGLAHRVDHLQAREGDQPLVVVFTIERDDVLEKAQALGAADVVESICDVEEEGRPAGISLGESINGTAQERLRGSRVTTP